MNWWKGLTAGDGSVLYGDSNSGKTLFVIDMAAAVARGARWMGRNTEPGLVVYLAAESPHPCVAACKPINVTTGARAELRHCAKPY